MVYRRLLVNIIHMFYYYYSLLILLLDIGMPIIKEYIIIFTASPYNYIIFMFIIGNRYFNICHL